MENQGTSVKESKKQSLLEKLKKKMGIDGTDDKKHYEDETFAQKHKRHGKNNKWAEKPTRKVELRWIHEGKQVRKSREGGTRSLDVAKDLKKS